MPKRKSRQQHFGIIDPGYARVFTQARIVAWQYGYACVMHGSFTRDLDLLMVPWEERAGDNHDQLLRLIASACNLAVPVDAARVIQWTKKPYGRIACSLSFTGFADRRWVDISFVPRTTVFDADAASVRVTDAGWAQLVVHGVVVESVNDEDSRQRLEEKAARINAARTAGVEGKCECGLSEVACRDPLRRSCPDGVEGRKP